MRSFKKIMKLVFGHGSSQKKALHIVAAQTFQHTVLRHAFHAFAYHGKTELMERRNQILYQ